MIWFAWKWCLRRNSCLKLKLILSQARLSSHRKCRLWSCSWSETIAAGRPACLPDPYPPSSRALPDAAWIDCTCACASWQAAVASLPSSRAYPLWSRYRSGPVPPACRTSLRGRSTCAAPLISVAGSCSASSKVSSCPSPTRGWSAGLSSGMSSGIPLCCKSKVFQVYICM